MPSIHQFKVNDLQGKEVKLEDYKGKVLLIVNTATGCGFTGQLKPMEDLYQSYKDKGFEILAFPSADFQNQEPLEGEAIQEFCEMRYHTTFKMFEKGHVKGPEAAQLFKFLADKKLNGKVSSTPKWNFHKYLVDKDGQVVDYYYTITDPNSSKVRKAIEKLL